MERIVLRTLGRDKLQMWEIIDRIRQRRAVQYPSEWSRVIGNMADTGALVRTWDDSGYAFYQRAQ